MPVTQLDDAWAYYDANQAPATLTRDQFDDLCKQAVHAVGVHRKTTRWRELLAAFTVGTVDPIVLEPLISKDIPKPWG